ncbi:MAG: S1 RNA-binding domain-containing protein [Clostridia bacterium]|nr:S1 RNA-binding domain-containing protein [Clostridia bacterium]
MNEFYPEGRLLNSKRNQEALRSVKNITEAFYEGRILEGRAIICNNEHDLIVDLGCMKGIIPREEGALGIREGKIKDIAVISRVNKPVCFVIDGFITDSKGEQRAVLSRRKAQEICVNEYIDRLTAGDVIDAAITHLESFGAFADIGCGIVALMPIDTISISRIDHPRERFSVGMNIKAVIKNKDNGKISLTHKELLGTWQENADLFAPNETVAGIVRSVEEYGAFIELTPNLSGLAEYKDGIRPKQQASVYIKSIIPNRMKIKLIIVDTFDYEYMPQQPKYFINSGHIDKFTYSPESCSKIVESVFK